MSIKTANRIQVSAVKSKRRLSRRYRRTATVVNMPAELLDVGVQYMKELKNKARLVSHALQRAKVPHAIIGGLAVAAHVARVDETAERNTQDLDILLDRDNLEAAKKALGPLGYRYRKVMRLHAFMPNVRKPKFADGVHIIWTREKVRPEYTHPAPPLEKHGVYSAPGGVNYLSLRELLVMKLTSFRLKDQVHIQDLLLMKLITKRIEQRLPSDLQQRLKYVKDQTERERL